MTELKPGEIVMQLNVLLVREDEERAAVATELVISPDADPQVFAPLFVAVFADLHEQMREAVVKAEQTGKAEKN